MDRLPPFGRAALLLDMDGTLIDLAPTPDAVVVPPGLPATLASLRDSLGGALAIVTGRPVETVDRLFGDAYVWSVLAAGRHQLAFTTMAGILGGNVRVGLEDSLYIAKGKLATSNAEQVSKIRGILEDLSLEIATPKEAREMLNLKGGDRVKF